MKPDPEKDILGENLQRSLRACDGQVERSHAEFLRRLGREGAPQELPKPRRSVSVGAVTVAASLFVCAAILIAIFRSGGAPVDTVAAPPAQDKQEKKASEEQSLLAQIALQEKILEKTPDEQDRALVQATIKTLRAELARVQKGTASKVEKKAAGDSMDDLERRAKEIPKDAQIHAILGEGWLKSKKWDLALEHGRKAVELQPDFARAHLLVGRACLVLKQADEADKAFARAQELDPSLAPAIQEARSSPTKTKVKVDPADDRASKLRAEQDGIFAKIKSTKEPDEKARLEMRAKEIGQELKLLEQGNRKEVNPKEVEMKLQKNPDDVTALVERGRYLIDQGKGSEALKPLDRAIEIKPDYAPAYLARGMAHAIAGNPEKANADVKRGAELDPTAKNDIDIARGTLKKMGSSQKESARSPKETEQQVAGLRERLDELKAMETNADLSSEERAKAGKEAARVQGEIEKLKASVPVEKKK